MIQGDTSKDRMNKKWLLLGFAIAHVFIIAYLFNSPVYDHRYTASVLYLDFANRTFEGLIPYRDFPMEYPPLALVLFLIPRIFTSNAATYTVYFTAEVILFDLAGLLLIYATARHFKFSPWLPLTVYTLLLLAMGPIVSQRFDLFPPILMLAALYFFWKGNNKTSWTMLALGTMVKLYPAVAAPIFFIHDILHRRYKRLIIGCLTFGAVCFISAYPYLLFARSGFIGSFLYHASRGLQMESTYASILLFLHNFAQMPLYLNYGFGSWNIGGPAADELAVLSSLVILALLFALYAIYALKERRRMTLANNDAPDWTLIGNFSTAAVIVFISAGKVFSPQFIVWLLPMMPLLVGTWKYPTWALFCGISLMTYFIFPPHYLDLLAFDNLTIDVLIWRNIFLVAVGVLAVIGTSPQLPRLNWRKKTK